MATGNEVLIVGCGSIGVRHATNAVHLGRRVQVYDRDKDCVARALAVDPDRITEYAGPFEDWSGKEVIVATPTHTHVQIASQFLGRGNRILIEKPLAASVEEGLQFLERCGETEEVYVACNLRFHPPVKVLHENLERVGKPLFARSYFGYFLPYQRPGRDYRQIYAANKAMGGGILLDAIHEVDYLIWFFGKPSNFGGGGRKLSDLDMDVEDFGWIDLVCEGVPCRVEMDYLRRYRERGCEIVGDLGTLVWRSYGKPETAHVAFLPDKNAEQEELLHLTITNDDEYVEMLQRFFAGGDATHLLQTAADALIRLEVTPRFSSEDSE